jgi:hypothetical protein
MEILTTEPLVCDPSPFDVENASSELKRYKLLGSDQILVELIRARCGTLHSEIPELINSDWSNEDLLQQ